jgi:hypothetical protein
MDTFATLINTRVVLPSQKTSYVAVDMNYFARCHGHDVAHILFDEDWYISRYPDIADALAAGVIGSAHEHYTQSGYYEHRMPYEIVVDERWYLESYGDVKEAVDKGVFSSAQDHFDMLGFREGRLPFAHFRLKTAA